MTIDIYPDILPTGFMEADQFVLKPELLLDLYLALASFEELHKDSLVELPGPVLIGISQSGANGALMPRCFNLPSQLLSSPVISQSEWARPN